MADVVVAADGSATVSAVVQNTTHGDNDLAVFRVKPNGDLDSSFSGDGMVTFDFTTGAERSREDAGPLLLEPDGAVTVGATRAVGPVGDSDDGYLLVRVRPDGARDTSFGGQLTPITPSFRPAHLERDGAGRFLFSGSDGFGFAAAARYDGAGRLDPTFGTSGVLRIDLHPNEGERGETRVLPDGRLLFVGEVGPNDLSDQLVVAKLRPKSASTSPPPPSPGPSSPTSPAAATAPPGGYWMVATNGDVFAFGDAAWRGNAPVGRTLAVDLEPTPAGNGYWIVGDAGHVFSFGDAPYLGGVADKLGAQESVTSISTTPSGRGYWIFTTTGRVITLGDAPFLGDMAGTALNGPVLDSIPTPTGRGYYMVASDGGIFTFGDARFHGSMGDVRLNAPVQSLVPDADGAGYWLVASDGGIFSFDAAFHGSMGSVRLNRPITGMVADRGAYLMVAEDGGIFTFGDATFRGSLGDAPPPHPVAAVASL